MQEVQRRKLITAGIGVALMSVLGSVGCCPPSATPAVTHAPSSTPADPSPGRPTGKVLRGDASYYAAFFAGRRTSNGERYDPRKFTAASRTLPFGTRLRVTRVDNGKSVVVRINDRGPFGKRRRILDLSRAAAEKLDLIRPGHAQVEAVVLE